MRKLLPWLPLLLLAAYSLALAVFTPERRCWAIPWLCSQDSVLLKTGMSSVILLLPLALALSRGLLAGGAQLARTRRMMRSLLVNRRHTPALLEPLAHRLGLARRLDVLEHPAPAAFCYGLLRPRVAVTTGLLDMLEHAEVEAVLRHERAP